VAGRYAQEAFGELTRTTGIRKYLENDDNILT